MGWTEKRNLNSCYGQCWCQLQSPDWLMICDAARLESHRTTQHSSLQIRLCLPVLNGSLKLERQGQVELEGIVEKRGGGTLPTGDWLRKIFTDILATRSTMQVYHYVFKLPNLGYWFNNSLPAVPSDCPKSNIISLLIDCLIDLVSLGLLSSASYEAFNLRW